MWLVFTYRPTSLFSLKSSRATSTAGKTLLTPTPYAAKMALVDVSLRHGLTQDPDWLVRALARVDLRIGVPSAASVTTTTQRIRQETRPEDRSADPSAPPYRATIALREAVHLQGTLSLAFDRTTCSAGLTELLATAAPGVNYMGKRGSFVQYCGSSERETLDPSFTQPFQRVSGPLPANYHIAALDDFGPGASFDALNSFSSTAMKRGLHRIFVETVVPLGIRNTGFGFVGYIGAAVPE